MADGTTAFEIVELLIDKAMDARAGDARATALFEDTRDKLREALLACKDAANARGVLAADNKRLNEAVSQLTARVTALVDGLRTSIATVEWMTGSSDFGPGGLAHEGWLKAKVDVDALRSLVNGTT